MLTLDERHSEGMAEDGGDEDIFEGLRLLNGPATDGPGLVLETVDDTEEGEIG